MSPLQAFEKKLAAVWEPSAWQDVTVLVAVSGGADSIALLRAMATIKCGGEGRLVAAHLNHQLRAAESDADEACVAELCRDLHVPCEAARVTLGDAVSGDSTWRAGGLEAAARAARYHFLTATADRLGARYVVTAHTADDQAETILHRILRGTGIGGLAGMARTRPLSGATTLIRPLLEFRHGEILEYLDAIHQPYCQDSSNTDLRFTRNRIRHELLPQLSEQFNAGVVEALLRLGTLAGEAHAVLSRLAEELAADGVACETSGLVRIAVSRLADQPAYVVRELLVSVWRQQGWPLQAMGLAQWEQLAEMIPCGGTHRVGCARPMAGGHSPQFPERRKQVFPGGVIVELTDGELRLVRPT